MVHGPLDFAWARGFLCLSFGLGFTHYNRSYVFLDFFSLHILHITFTTYVYIIDFIT